MSFFVECGTDFNVSMTEEMISWGKICEGFWNLDIVPFFRKHDRCFVYMLIHHEKKWNMNQVHMCIDVCRVYLSRTSLYLEPKWPILGKVWPIKWKVNRRSTPQKRGQMGSRHTYISCSNRSMHPPNRPLTWLGAQVSTVVQSTAVNVCEELQG